MAGPKLPPTIKFDEDYIEPSIDFHSIGLRLLLHLSELGMIVSLILVLRALT